MSVVNVSNDVLALVVSGVKNALSTVLSGSFKNPCVKNVRHSVCVYATRSASFCRTRMLEKQLMTPDQCSQPMESADWSVLRVGWGGQGRPPVRT